MPVLRLHRVLFASLPALAVLIWSAAPAAAGQPIFVDEATPTASAPVLGDGTATTTVYGLLSAPTSTSSVRAQFNAGDQVVVTLMVPDRAPENELSAASMPTLRVVAPDGTMTTAANGDPVPGAPPDPSVSVLRLAIATQTAPLTGVYTFTVTAVSPTRFALRIGTRDGAQPVTDYTEPPAGALESWYATPPPDAAAFVDGTGGEAGDAAKGGDLDVARMAGPAIDDSTPGLAAGLPLGFAALAILVVTLVIFVKARRRSTSRPGPDGPAVPPDQFSDGLGG